ncbi:hypothetical protein ACFQNE_17500 [Gordonia phosphorivorans]|uniref:DUF1772 domain-containing protein n=1 Tax=Gordonia phosphorivorans TaxID=1056982 RepID=A0ABV6HCV8_9ACTN
MQQRLFALVIAVLATTASWLTTLPWADIEPAMETAFRWNGFGTLTAEITDPEFPTNAGLEAAPLGMWVAVACLLALAAAVAMAIPKPALATPLRWIAAGATLAAAVIPIVVLLSPSTFLGRPFDAMGIGPILTDDHYDDIVGQLLERTTLIALAVVLVVLAAVCAAAALAARRSTAAACPLNVAARPENTDLAE